MAKKLLLLFLLPSFLFSEIISNEKEPELKPAIPSVPIAPTPPITVAKKSSFSPFLAGLNRTSTLLFYILNKTSTSFIAPFAIDSSLLMAYRGSNGRTTDELKATLHQTLSPEETQTAYETLYSKYQGEEGSYRLLLANGVWITEASTLLPDYTKSITSSFHGRIQKVNFNDSAKIAGMLNQWISEKTEGQLKASFKATDIEGGSNLLLTSAFAFQGEWEKPFERKDTGKELFHPTNAASTPITMMKQTNFFPYFENEETQLLALPIKKVGEVPSLAFLIFLPKKQITGELFNYYYSLAQDKEGGFLSYLEEMKSIPLSIKIPLLSLHTSLDISPLLYAIGIKDAFFPQADFSKIDGRKDLYIGQVVHQCHLSLNEDGIAAPLTGGEVFGLGKSLEKGKEPLEFLAAHPFLYLLIDLESKLIFAIGEYNGPFSGIKAPPPKTSKQKSPVIQNTGKNYSFKRVKVSGNQRSQVA
ncbi:MAG: serpin family protein [Simkania negevensis]|nr:serpin family protein [Simkania negevensis]